MKKAFLVIVIIFLNFANTYAEEPPLVEVVSPKNYFDSYKNRRSWHGFVFNIHLKNYEPKQFTSAIDGQSYADVFGSPLQMTDFGLGYKLNFFMGSVNFGATYSVGRNSSGEYTLAIDQILYSAQYSLDTITDEPYVVPYIKYAIQRSTVKESNTSTTKSSSTNNAPVISAGLLIQLNSLDESTALNSRKAIGLENTFLDIFASQYSKSSLETDPDLSSSLALGAGLSFEF